MATIFEVDLPNMTAFPYGTAKSTVESHILDTNMFPGPFGNSTSDLDHVRKVDDGDNSYIEMESTVGDHGRQHWRVEFPGGAVETAYMRTSFMFTSHAGSTHPGDGGYDWARSETAPIAQFTGGKFNGLAYGNMDDSTGGTLANGAWSGRHMFRGRNTTSPYNGNNDRTGITAEFYYYGEDEGTANSYRWIGDHDTANAVRFGSNGGTTTGQGSGQYGDPDVFPLSDYTDTWIHVIAGYHAPDSADGWYKCWTWIDGVDTSWQPQLFKDGMRYRPSGSSGVDSYIFVQNFGGGTSDWRPDLQGRTRFKDIGVYTTLAEAESAFGLGVSATSFQITSPMDMDPEVGSPIVVSGAGDDTALGYEVQVDGGLWVPATYNPTLETFTADSVSTFTEDGGSKTVRARRYS